VIMLLGMFERAHAFCQPGDEQICFANGEEGTRVCGANSQYGPCSTATPPPPTCPAIAPIPSDSFQCECKSRSQTRCADTITAAICGSLNTSARSLNYINDSAVTWLTANGYCAVVYDMMDGNGTRLQGVCRPGCFAEDTQIMTGFNDDGSACNAPAAAITELDTLLSMADESNLVGVELVSRSIRTPVHGPETPALFVFALGNGSTLRVTQHHPMVLANGLIVEAAQVKHGAAFVGIDGKPVAVTSISREQTTGDVYNFETASDTQLGHIIVAEGVLVGDLKLQNDLASEQTSIELRR